MIHNPNFDGEYMLIHDGTGNDGKVNQPLNWGVSWVEPDDALYDSADKAAAVPYIGPAGNSGIAFGHFTHAYGGELVQSFGLVRGDYIRVRVSYSANVHGDPDRYGAELGVFILDENDEQKEGGWLNGLTVSGDATVHYVADHTGMHTLAIRVKSKWNKPKEVTIKSVEVSLEKEGTLPPTEPPTTVGGELPKTYFPQSVTEPVRSKLSLHHMPGGKIDLITNWLELAPEAIVFFGNWGLATHCKPETVYRVGVRNNQKDAQRQYEEGQSPRDAAVEFIGWHEDGYEADTAISHWSGHNEPVVKDPTFMQWLAQFEIERMKLMAARGWKCAIGKFSTGSPELDLWEHFMPAIEAAHRYDAILLLHEYGGNVMWWGTGHHQLANLRDAALPGQTEPYVDRHMLIEPDEFAGHQYYHAGWLTLRYRQVYNLIRHYLPDLPDLPLVIAESGLDIVGGVPKGWKVSSWLKLRNDWRRLYRQTDTDKFFVEQLIWYDNEVRRDHYLKAFCVFTYGHQDSTWQYFDFAGTRAEALALEHVGKLKRNPTLPLPIPVEGSAPPPPPDPQPDPQPTPDPPVSGENLLVNPSFEDTDWETLPPVGGVRSQRPTGWEIGWVDLGKRGRAGLEITVVPEMLHKRDHQLPPKERPGGEKPLILDGKQVYKIFGRYGRFEASLSQPITGLEPHATVEFTASIQVHWHGDSVKEDDDAEVWLIAGSKVSKYLYKKDIDDREWLEVTVRGKASASGVIVITILFFNRWLNSRDLFVESTRAVVVEKEAPQPVPNTLTLLDVSRYQGTIDWPTVVKQGVSGVYLAMGRGVTTDEQLETNKAVTRQNGILAGFYWAILPNHDIVRQANAFVEAYKVYAWGDNFILPPAVDCERDGVTAKDIKLFVDTFERKTKVKTIIYTRAEWWNRTVPKAATWLKGRLLWVAHYGTIIPDLPHHWDNYFLHQYTDEGRVQGIRGDVDLNRFVGSEKELRKIVMDYRASSNQPPVNYKRRAILFPPDIDFDEFVAVAETYEDERITMLFSADDCGHLISTGAAGSFAYVVAPERWTSGSIIDYLYDNYGIETKVIRLDQPTPPPPAPDHIPVIPINQRDRRWADLRIGTSNKTAKTIGNWGCLLTSYLVMYNYMLDMSENPAQANQRFIEGGGFSGPFLVNGALKRAMPNKFDYDGYLKRNDRRMLPKIDEWLKLGIPVPCQVDFKPATTAWEDHWVLLIGKRGDAYIAADPWHGDVVSLPTRYGIAGVDVIQALFYKLKEDSSQPAPPQPAPQVDVAVGVHGEEGGRWMLHNELRGAIVHTVALGTNATRLNFNELAQNGIEVYARLNYGYHPRGTVPEEGSPDWSRFADACIETMRRSSGVAGYYIGNEPNNSHEWPNGVPIQPEKLAEITNIIYKNKPAGARLGAAPVDPFFGPFHLYGQFPHLSRLANSGYWWKTYLRHLDKADFLVVHSKTQDSSPGNVDSMAKFSDDPLKWQYLHFNSYKAILEMVPNKHRHLNVVMAEANPQRKQDRKTLGWECSLADKWIKAAYANIQAHNRKPDTQKVVAVIFYRWQHDDWAIYKCSPATNAIKQLASQNAIGA